MITAKSTSEDGGGIFQDSRAIDNDTIGNWAYNIGDYSNPCPRVHGIYHAGPIS